MSKMIRFEIRPLSKCMIETLMEIHEREILGQELCDQQTKHVKGLYERRLISTRNCINRAGKPYLGFYVTDVGKEYLNNLMEEKEKNTTEATSSN